MEERVFNYNIPDIPLWKWIVLHFSKTYINRDIGVPITTICYVKKLFNELYIWKTIIYDSSSGQIRIEELKWKNK